MKNELMVNVKTGEIRSRKDWVEKLYDEDIHSYGFGWYESPADVFIAMLMDGTVVNVSEV